MERPSILLTRHLPEEYERRLRSETQVYIWPEYGPMPRPILLERIVGSDAVICMLSDRMDAEVMDSDPELRAIGNYAVGYDNIDIAAATERGIPVFNTPGVLTDATADMAFALLMAVSRRIVEGDRMVREGRWRTWSPTLLLGKDLTGARIGVVGAGKIGSAVLRRAKGFGMEMTYHSRHRDEVMEGEIGARYLPLDELLRTSDVVSLNVPLTKETHHLIGERELSLMKRDAVLINTARGPVVDERALVKALRDGVIGGAGLDVYENEPQIEPGLDKLDNVVLAPHLGSATVMTRARMARMVIDDVLDHLSGKLPKNCVNPSVLGSTRRE
jgi:glyoxylate reductase